MAKKIRMDDFEFIDNSDAVKEVMNKIKLEWLEAAALIVEARAVALCAVDTGRLRNSIDHVVDEREMVALIGSPLEYAIYIEFGTGEFAENGKGRRGGWVYQAPSGEWFFTFGQPAQPFLRPAFRKNKKEIQKLLEEMLGELNNA